MNIQYHVNEIKLFDEPRKKILPQITQIPNEPEMTEFESSFLCGVLKKFQPHKILEVGIALGGSTAIILQCLDMLQLDHVEMHSVDFSERFYLDNQYVSGFLGIEAKEIIKNPKIQHTFHLGNIACTFMNEIGDQIDCLILDTTHSLPGEVLEFLTILPFLKDGAVVILHDIRLNQFRGTYKMLFATGTLFSSVVAEKYWNDDIERNNHYPNIGAFVINSQTRRYISNVYLSLMLTWASNLSEDQFNIYKNFLSKYYDKDLVEIFEKAYYLNEQKITKCGYLFPHDKIRCANHIVLYGAGKVGNMFYQNNQENQYFQVVKWVDRNYKQLKNVNGFQIDSIESIFDVDFDLVVIAVLDAKIAEEIKQDLIQMGIEQEKIVWSEYYRI